MLGAVDFSLIKQPIMSPLLAANILPEIEVSACFRLAISLNLFFVLACFFANFFVALAHCLASDSSGLRKKHSSSNGERHCE